MIEIVLREEKVLRAGLAVDLEAARLRRADLLHRLARGYVNDEDRHIDKLGERDRARCRLAFRNGGVRDGMEAWGGVPGRQQLLAQPGDDVVVLGMDHDEGALAPGDRKHFENLAVIELERIVRRVDLERSVAVLD